MSSRSTTSPMRSSWAAVRGAVRRGVIIVATSNTVPDDLFKGRPGRDAFLPFIAVLKRNLDVLVMEGGPDYRRDRLRGMPTWYVPADAGHAGPRWRVCRAGRACAVRAGAAQGDGPTSSRCRVAAGGVARFDFDELCGTPLGPGDYLALATHFETLVLDGSRASTQSGSTPPGASSPSSTRSTTTG